MRRALLDEFPSMQLLILVRAVRFGDSATGWVPQRRETLATATFFPPTAMLWHRSLLLLQEDLPVQHGRLAAWQQMSCPTLPKNGNRQKLHKVTPAPAKPVWFSKSCKMASIPMQNFST